MEALPANPEVIGIGARVNKEGKGLEFLLLQGDPAMPNGYRRVFAEDGREWHRHNSAVFYRILLKVATDYWQSDDESENEDGDE